MVSWWVMFSVVVGHVLRSFTPIETELSLGGAATKPMEAHPNHFDTVLDDVLELLHFGGLAVDQNGRSKKSVIQLIV